MNIKRAKQEIKNTIRAYQLKNADGTYRIPSIRQRPVLLMGPPGVGKTQIMEQIAEECDLPLVSYTITHHTRQSANDLAHGIFRFRIWWEDLFCNGIYHERDHCICL